MLYVGILQNTCEVFLEASRKFYKYLYVSMSWPSFYSSVFPTFRILCLSKSRKCWHIENQNLKLGTHTMFKKASNWPKSGILHFKKNNLELTIMQSWRHCCEISGLHSRVIESTWVSQASQGDLGQFSNPLMFLELIFKIPHFKYLLLLLFACKALLEKNKVKCEENRKLKKKNKWNQICLFANSNDKYWQHWFLCFWKITISQNISHVFNRLLLHEFGKDRG